MIPGACVDISTEVNKVRCESCRLPCCRQRIVDSLHQEEIPTGVIRKTAGYQKGPRRTCIDPCRTENVGGLHDESLFNIGKSSGTNRVVNGRYDARSSLKLSFSHNPKPGTDTRVSIKRNHVSRDVNSISVDRNAGVVSERVKICAGIINSCPRVNLAEPPDSIWIRVVRDSQKNPRAIRRLVLSRHTVKQYDNKAPVMLIIDHFRIEHFRIDPGISGIEQWREEGSRSITVQP